MESSQQQADWGDGAEIDDPQEHRRRDPGDDLAQGQPRPLHRPEPGWSREAGDDEHRAEGEYHRCYRAAPPCKQATEYEKRRAHGEAELTARGDAQSSWNSLRQSPLSCHAGCSVLSNKNGPRASQSMWVRMKQRYASAGVQTIGSPRTLNEVFTRTAQPVRRSNSLRRS